LNERTVEYIFVFDFFQIGDFALASHIWSWYSESRILAVFDWIILEWRTTHVSLQNLRNKLSVSN